MYLCFVWSETSSEAEAGESTRIQGQARTLGLIKSEKEGPWYPHFVEKATEESYRFFAGRLAGVIPGSSLPEEHAVQGESAEKWEFDGAETDGSWIALKFDRRRDVLSITSDLFLMQRWFYTTHGGKWYFSNSLLFLQRVLKGALEIEERSVPYMLYFGFLPPHYTPLKSVFQLRAGHALVFEKGESRLAFRSHLPIRFRCPQITENIPQAIHTALHEAIAQETAGLDSVVIPLSSGLDSRFILGCALELLEPEQITTITFGLPSSLDYRVGTAIAKRLGLKHHGLPRDPRFLDERMDENFPNAEGIYWTHPDYPVGPMHAALPEHSLVLSGYIGFRTGSWFFRPGDPVDGTMEEAMVNYLFKSCNYGSLEDTRALMRDRDVDPYRLASTVTLLPGADLQENWEYWQYENYLLNRNNATLQLFRDRAIYAAPFMHRKALDVSYSVPPGDLRCTKAFFEAHRRSFPHLYGFPTSRNFGFPPGTAKGLKINAARTWRKTRSLLDDYVGQPLGKRLYQHPFNAYVHPREICRREYHAYMAACMDRLKSLTVVDTAAVDALKQKYLKGKRVNIYLLRGVLTIAQWIRHYRGS